MINGELIVDNFAGGGAGQSIIARSVKERNAKRTIRADAL